MDKNTERIFEINKRKAEIRGILEAGTAENLEEIETELRSLDKEVFEIEKRMKLLDGIKPVERKEEERKMENLTYSVETLEFRNAFLKNLQGKELTAEERTAVTATAAIPTITMNKVVEKLEASPLYARIDATAFPGGVTYPVENSCADASWVAMASAASDSNDSLASVTLSAYKLIKTIEIGANVQAMAVDAFEAYIVDRLYKKLIKAVDNAVLNGTGSNQPTGLLKVGEITNTTTYTKTAMKFSDICKIIGLLPSGYHQNACFIMPRALFYGEVLGMETTTEDKVCVADAQSPAKFNILGYPVLIDDNCTADTILFGDLSYYKFNWAEEATITSDASVGFRTGSTVYRAMALADGKLSLAEAFVCATRAA